MKWFYNMKLTSKLITSFMVVAIVVVIVGMVGINSINSLNADDTKLYEKMTVPLGQLVEISSDFQQIRVSARDMVLAKSPAEVEQDAQKITELRNNMEKSSHSFAETILSASIKEAYDTFTQADQAYEADLDQVITLARANKDKEAIAYLQMAQAVSNQAAEENALDKLVQLKIAAAKAQSDTNTALTNQVSKTLIMVIVLGFLLAIALGLFISQVIGKPVKKLTEAADKLALGDTEVDIQVDSKDEIGNLARSFEIMAENIKASAIAVEKLANGEKDIVVAVKSEKDILNKNLNNLIQTINNILVGLNSLGLDIRAGKLQTRGNDSKYKGDWQELVREINELINACVEPIQLTAEYIEHISKGNMPPKITKQSHGDFNLIKDNLNHCIEVINNLIKETVGLAKFAVEGKLDARGDANKFEGDYQEIIQGLNGTLDALVAPIKETEACLEQMAKGNLDVKVTGDYQGDHAVMKKALNNTLDEMNDLLYQVSMAVDQVAAGSRQISESSQSLSQGASESASAVEEISSSMQQMSSQTNQNAENATQANQLAIMARDSAEKGNEMMRQMEKAMQEINLSATDISKIIKVIDEIAFQTNILALNAAVEAARAGKHGKGFTVVAEEVRNLAQRSAQAAKETTEMIEDSIKKTELGTKIAEGTSESLNEIVGGSTKVTDLISEIAAASREQAQGVGQINQGINQVDQVTQQNTASSEELASAGEELSSQAVQLKGMLAKFKLRRQGYGQRPMAIPEKKKLQYTEAKREVAAAKEKVKPEDVISLDDGDFGSF